MTTQIHTTRKISFESESGELDLALDDQGFSLRAFMAEKPDAPAATVAVDHLPVHMAIEIRDFLVYALRGETA